MAKEVREWSAGDGAFSRLVKSRRYVYDGWNMIAELDTSDSPSTSLQQARVASTYVWGPDLAGQQGSVFAPESVTFAGGVGGLLAVNHQGTTYYPCMDANGNIMGLVDATTGTLTARYDYDPFGARITDTGPTGSNGERIELCPFGFSSKYTDSETGLVYYGFRYYSPELGRWVSEDPIGERGGINLYGMMGNDAVNFVDILGLQLQPRKAPCPCDEKEVNKIAHQFTTKANQLTKADMANLPQNAIKEDSTGREFGGYVCCNSNTKKVEAMDPERGEWKVTPVLRRALYVGQSIDILKMKKCSTKGADWKMVGFYHSHPASTGVPSENDIGVMFQYLGGYPMFTGGSGGVTRTDPVSVPTPNPFGSSNRQAGLPSPVNPDGTTGQPMSPVYPPRGN